MQVTPLTVLYDLYGQMDVLQEFSPTQKRSTVLLWQCFLLVTDLRRQTLGCKELGVRELRVEIWDSRVWGSRTPTFYPQHLTVQGDSLQQRAPSMHWQYSVKK